MALVSLKFPPPPCLLLIVGSEHYDIAMIFNHAVSITRFMKNSLMVRKLKLEKQIKLSSEQFWGALSPSSKFYLSLAKGSRIVILSIYFHIKPEVRVRGGKLPPYKPSAKG